MFNEIIKDKNYAESLNMKELLKINTNNISKIQETKLREYTIKKLEWVISCIKNNKLDQIPLELSPGQIERHRY